MTTPKILSDFKTFEEQKAYLLSSPQVHFLNVGEVRQLEDLKVDDSASFQIVKNLFLKLGRVRVDRWLRKIGEL